MFENDDLAIAPSLGTLSLDRLAEFAMEEELIDHFDFLPDSAIIVQGDIRFVLPHRQACTFLIGMLRGRSWYVEDDRKPFRDEQEVFSLTPQEAPSTRRDLESTLEALLGFTREVGIIDGFEHDVERRAVRIDIPACSTTMSYVDALGYLFDCVQHEVRSMTSFSD